MLFFSNFIIWSRKCQNYSEQNKESENLISSVLPSSATQDHHAEDHQILLRENPEFFLRFQN